MTPPAQRAWLSDVMTDVPSRLTPMVGALTTGCEQDERVRAGWLGGSLARGNGDDWSDIDLHLAVADPAAFDVPSWLGGLTPMVLADPIPGVHGGYLCLTPEWVHIDVIVHSANGFTQDEHQPCSVLLDRDRLLHTVAAQDEEVREPYYPADQVRIFVYFMGNAVTVLHRGELIVLSQGCAVMRDSLIALMLAENGVTKTDGAKRLNRYLTDEQRVALSALTPIGVDESGLRAGQAGIAGEYLTRARRLAEDSGAPWPEELVGAAIALWERELQLTPAGWLAT